MAPVKNYKQKSSGGNVLPDDVAALYEPAEGILPIFCCAEFGMVNLASVTPDFAAQLAEAGYLKAKKKLTQAESN